MNFNNEDTNEKSGHYENEPQAEEITEDETENADDEASEEDNVIDEKRERLWHYASMAAAAAAVIACGFLIGRFAVPVSESKVSDMTAELFKTDEDYRAAVSEGKAINAEIDSLNADNERIENSFNDVVEYEKQLDKLKADFKSVNDKLYDARSTLKAMKDDYDSKQTSLTRLKSRTVTLSPGTYTVGIHIPAGAYSATGNGSFLTAGSDKNLKINVNLDRNPYLCSLAENDTIKLSCKAEFKPEVEER